MPTEEEKRKITDAPQYGHTSPQGTYYGENGNVDSEAMRQMINDWAAKTDPKAQAEQDARIQRGRQFWTGANLFANVVANAVNVGGTSNGAPNMTWNDASSQKMYDTWRTADKELKADRMAAQQRLDALRMQDARMRSAGAEKRAAESKGAYDTNFNIGIEDYRHRRNQEAEKAKRDEQWKHDAEVREDTQKFQSSEAAEGRAFTESQNKENREYQANRDEMRLQKSKGYNKGNKTIRIGNTDFKAETEAEADANIAQVYGMVLEAYNRQPNINATNQQVFDGKPETEYSFINAHFNQLYASDPAFKAQYNAWANEHWRSVNSNNQSSGSWLQ